MSGRRGKHSEERAGAGCMAQRAEGCDTTPTALTGKVRSWDVAAARLGSCEVAAAAYHTDARHHVLSSLGRCCVSSSQQNGSGRSRGWAAVMLPHSMGRPGRRAALLPHTAAALTSGWLML